jgi:sulfide:quinone oxidoreductase
MLDRRQFLAATALVGTGALVWPGAPVALAAPISTNARIIIIGAGAAGTALANRLVRRLEGAQITLIDPRPNHLYQPGLTLVAAGLKPADYVVSETTEWLPREVSLIGRGGRSRGQDRLDRERRDAGL